MLTQSSSSYNFCNRQSWKPKMYVDTSTTCNFDPNTDNTTSTTTTNPMSDSTFAPPPHHDQSLTSLSMEEDLSQFHHHHHNAAAMDIEHHLHSNDMSFTSNTNPFDTPITWDNTNINNTNEIQQMPPMPTPDLLSLFHLPNSSSILPHSSINFTNTTTNPSGGCFGYDPFSVVSETPSSVVGGSLPSNNPSIYDPMFHLNQQPPLFRELLHSFPHGYNLSRNGSSGLFGSNAGGGDELDEGSRQLFENGVLEFSKEMKPFGRGRGGNKGTKHFATERQRRVQLNDKFSALRDLVPNPTKPDRASVVGDAIDYIQELKRTVSELKLLVEKKRYGRERSKRHKTEQDNNVGAAGDDVESCNMKPLGDPDQDHSFNNGSLRSSWLQRKSKDTEVDVRIIDDEVTIKLVQRKKINLLLSVSKLLDELQLELHHAAGGHIGNSYSFLFNTKMYEGSSLYASAIANKLIDTLDKQYAVVPPTNNGY